MKPNIKALAISTSIVVSLIFALALATEVPGPPATDLKLAPDLSFSDDSSSNFPIEGENLSDGSIGGDHATVIFFGTANCWNTAREAERLVQLYPRYKDKIRFVVVDLRKPSLAQQALIDRAVARKKRTGSDFVTNPQNPHLPAAMRPAASPVK